MNHIQRHRRFNRTVTGHKSQLGFVLPVALILLVIITGIVGTQLQRALLDERMAANSRENIVADSAAQTVLRWCELQLTNAPDSTVLVDAPSRGATAAWKEANNWTAANTFTVTGVTLSGVTSHSCLVENADNELTGGVSDSGDPGDPTGRARWIKYRITARVERTTGGFDHSQSEIRLYRR
jgi:Tfp pilus assembly protein PilX